MQSEKKDKFQYSIDSIFMMENVAWSNEGLSVFPKVGQMLERERYQLVKSLIKAWMCVEAESKNIQLIKHWGCSAQTL